MKCDSAVVDPLGAVEEAVVVVVVHPLLEEAVVVLVVIGEVDPVVEVGVVADEVDLAPSTA
jgi:hypothetical protein